MKKIKSIAIAVIIMVACTTVSFAQSKTSVGKKASTQTEQKKTDYYTCSMHPKVREATAGKCPKCSMALVKKTVKAAKATTAAAFQCPMKCEGEKTYAKAGKCPKCDMAMAEVKTTEKKNAGHGHSHGDDGHQH